MRRIHITLDEGLYERLREAARTRGTSMSALIRESLEHSLRRKGRRDFSFVGAGSSERRGSAPVSAAPHGARGRPDP